MASKLCREDAMLMCAACKADSPARDGVAGQVEPLQEGELAELRGVQRTLHQVVGQAQLHQVLVPADMELAQHHRRTCSLHAGQACTSM